MAFNDEIKDRLVAQGVGTYGSNIISGSKGVIPVGDGPYLSIIETGGTAPLRIQNVPGAHVQRPSAQILTRGKNYAATRTMAKNAYLALDGVYNATLTGTFYQQIQAVQEPTDIGLDAAGRVMIVFNVQAMKAPS